MKRYFLTDNIGMPHMVEKPNGQWVEAEPALALRSLLQAIYDAEYGFGEWPEQGEIEWLLEKTK